MECKLSFSLVKERCVSCYDYGIPVVLYVECGVLTAVGDIELRHTSSAFQVFQNSNREHM